MIINEISITPKEDEKKAVLALLVDLIKAVRKEKGSKSAELYTLYEQDGDLMAKFGWKDEAAYLAHQEGKAFQTFHDEAASLVETLHSRMLMHIVIENEQHPLDDIYDAVYDLSLSIPFAGPTTKKILDKAHMREVGKGFMIGFKPFYPRRTLGFIGKKSSEFLEKKTGIDHRKVF